MAVNIGIRTRHHDLGHRASGRAPGEDYAAEGVLANGTGYDSDILRAIYYAVAHGAKVMNMSFDYSSYSSELARPSSMRIARESSRSHRREITEYTMVYPGGLPGVIDVASTSDTDVQSSFTNYGAPPVWMAAPGESIVTTYPWGTYAAGWGTSFSTPFVAGTAALMMGTNGNCSSSAVPAGLADADYIGNLNLVPDGLILTSQCCRAIYYRKTKYVGNRKCESDVPGLLLRIKELEEQHLAFRNSLVCAFNQMLDLKDINTGVHSTRLAEWALRVARKMQIPEERVYQVEVAALLHDVGKIGVPDAILKKAKFSDA